QGKLAALHRSLDHKQIRMNIDFQGSAIWLYGPPRSQLQAIPMDYKICLYEIRSMASDAVCFRVDVAEAYSFADSFDTPVVIFAKGGLKNCEHRIVVSVGDPVDEVDRYRGIQFSHAVYATERPTPWPTEEDNWRFREVAMHDTHPLLSYWPKSTVSSSWWPWESSELSGWFNKKYRAEDGSWVSWHELRSRGESDLGEWGLDATVTAGVVAIYGIPKARITDINSLINICVRIDSGSCEHVDVQHAYLNTEHHQEAILLWRNQALDSYRQTRVSIRLIKTSDSNLKVFPFKALHYWEQQEYSSPDPPVGRLENVAVAHDDRAIAYHPGSRCVKHFAWWCTGWFDPWRWREDGPSGSVLTYRSTVSSYRTTEDPSITMDFQGSAVYVYGAPKSFMKDGFAPQHVCLNDICHVVDLEQAYLNALEAPFESTSTRSFESLDSVSNATVLSPIHPELDPVLIWSMTGLDDMAQHSLRLALAALPSGDDTEMTIAKVVYTKVIYESGKSRPDTPVPQPDNTDGGPIYPPHAVKWAPRPLPSPPSSPPPSLPLPPAPPPRQRPRGETSIWPFIIWPSFGMFAFLSLLLCCLPCNESPERRRIRPESPPPPYVPPARPRPPSQKPEAYSVQPGPREPQKPTPPVYYTHSSTVRSGPSSTRADPGVPEFSRAVRKSNPGTSEPQQVLPSPGPSTKLRMPNPLILVKDQNNAGPCPGSNVAPQKPEYTENAQTQPMAPPSQKSSDSPTSTSNQVKNIASPIPGYDSSCTIPKAPSYPAPRLVPERASSASYSIASSSRVPPNDATRQPPRTTLPNPRAPLNTHHAISTTVTNSSPWVASKIDSRVRRTERDISHRATPLNTDIDPQVIPNRSRRSRAQETRGQSTSDMHRPKPQTPVPQARAYTHTPALAQWIESQGYRIDRLMDATPRNAHVVSGPYTRARRNQGLPRNAMPPFNTAVQGISEPGPGNTNWHTQRSVAEQSGRAPVTSNVPADREFTHRNRREQGWGELEGNQRAIPIRNHTNESSNNNSMRIEIDPRQEETRNEVGGAGNSSGNTSARRYRNNRRSNRARSGQGQR
ncbi:hypothetical protein RHS04_00006, partial [Rhizoctonia solani]